MNFSEKLQQLRKQKKLTQDQLAEMLFISRTAISKWESGKGYPNIESLKSISKLFSVSIDDLLSSEEVIFLAENENRFNLNKVLSLVYGLLDLMAIIFLFLPFYGQHDGDFIRLVNLFSYQDISDMTKFLFYLLPILMGILGITELLIHHFENERWLNISKNFSIILNAIMILVFILTRQPYVTTLLFMFLMIKIVLLVKNNR